MIEVMARVRCLGAALSSGLLILALSPAQALAEQVPDKRSDGWFEVVEEEPPTAPSHDSSAGKAPAAAPDESGDEAAGETADASSPLRRATGEPAVAEPPSGPPAPYHPAADDGTYAEADPRALSDFQDALAPYGHWVEHDRFGTVWVPDREAVGDDFAPYVTRGHWALDRAGEWMWVSDYPFGWVVFHYGRWVWVEGLGWAWIPGRKYAPAWVVWRVPEAPAADGVTYVGWAPAPPRYYWRGGFAYYWGYDTYYPWVFVPSPYAFYPHVHRYVVIDRHRAYRAAKATRHYRPSRPGVTSPQSPAPRTAGVPDRRIPRERIAAHPSARKFAERPTPERLPTRVSREAPELRDAPTARERRNLQQTYPAAPDRTARDLPRRAEGGTPAVSRPRLVRPAARGLAARRTITIGSSMSPSPARVVRPAGPVLRAVPRGTPPPAIPIGRAWGWSPGRVAPSPRAGVVVRPSAPGVVTSPRFTPSVAPRAVPVPSGPARPSFDRARPMPVPRRVSPGRAPAAVHRAPPPRAVRTAPAVRRPATSRPLPGAGRTRR